MGNVERRKLVTIEHPDQDNDKLKKMKVHLVAFHDDRRPLKTTDPEDAPTYPVKLRVTFDRKPFYFGTPIKVTPEDYVKITGAAPRGQFRDKRQIIWDLLKHAYDILLEMGEFDYSMFKVKLRGEKNDWSDIWAIFGYQIKELEQDGRFNYATTFRTAKKSFSRFTIDRKKPVRFFDDINKKWLEDYERWAGETVTLKNGTRKTRLSRSSIGVNTRNLKVLFNLAIRNGGTTKNPFIEYKPPTADDSNRGLTIEEIISIAKHESDSEFQNYCRDLFIFSYYGSGMNFADMFRLQYSNILSSPNEKGELADYLVYERKKTSRKRKTTLKRTSFKPQMKRIVERWGNPQQSKQSYIFPLLNGITSEAERVKKIGHMTKSVNTHLKQIASKLGIDHELSTYYARHSYVTGAVNAGVNPHLIQQQLGHSSLAVTERYIARLGLDKIDEATAFLPELE